MYWLLKLPTTIAQRLRGGNVEVADSTPINMEYSRSTSSIKNVESPEAKSQFSSHYSQHKSYNPLSEASNMSNMSVIKGPRTNRGRYYISLCIMFTAGSGSDFLAKLVYQFLPADLPPLVFYWMAWLLTLSAFFICIFALINGRESFKILNWKYFMRICIPAWCDVFVSGGRYVALVFLPASIVSILKNGLQLVFLAMIRGILSQYITKWQVSGIAILWIGLLLCMLEDILQIDNSSTWYGLILMFFVGLFGAIRNSIEEFLLKKEGFHPDFILGLEGTISFTTMLIIGVIFLFSSVETNEFYLIPGEVAIFFSSYVGSMICVVIFMFVLVTKKSMQFHVTQMSSAMTRKLFQQFYPIGVWIFVLIAYYGINPRFGEPWDEYQW
eukprot:26032_1